MHCFSIGQHARPYQHIYCALLMTCTERRNDVQRWPRDIGESGAFVAIALYFRGTSELFPHFPIVNRSSTPDRAQTRAERLQREANNCLALAVTERSLAFAVQLIDEAAKLYRRANELHETPQATAQPA